MLKKILNIFLILLFLWFVLDIIGISGFVDTLGIFSLDGLWLFLLTIFLILYKFKESIGKWILSIFLVLWFVLQYNSHWRYFLFGAGATEKGIKNYNMVFGNTHHIIPMSDMRIIPDTYHIILVILIMICSILLLIYNIKAISQKK